MPVYTRFITSLLVLIVVFCARLLPAQCSSFFATFTTTPQAVCNGSPVTVTAVPHGGTGPYTYHWSTNQTTQSIVRTLNASTTVWATVTDANGCNATLYIPLEPVFSYTFDIIPNVTTICEGGASMLCGHFGPAPAQYNYVWSTGAPTYEMFIQQSGTYTVTVTDPLTGCTAAHSEYIAINTIPPLNPQVIGPPSLNNDGYAVLSVSGGPYENYFWTPNFAFTPEVTVFTPGTYTVEVRIGGCVETASIDISATAECPPPQLSGVSTPNTSCIQSNGSIDLSVSPAGSYTYLWSNGAITQDPTNLDAGSYTVTVTTPMGCTAVTVFSVKNFANPIPAATGAAATCNMNNGYINLSVSGHYPPFTYLWSNGATTEDINHLAPGDYTVTVTGANGCTAPASATVTNYTGPLWTLSASMTPPTSCVAPNGAINITVMPHPPNAYTFLWSNGATTADISNVPAGTYTVTITNTVGCTTSTTFNLQSNVVPPALTTQTTAANCGQANGSVTLNVTPAAGATNQSAATATTAGTYALLAEANGCVDTALVNVIDLRNQPAAILETLKDTVLDCISNELSITAQYTGTENGGMFWMHAGAVMAQGSAMTVNTPGLYQFVLLDSLSFCSDTSELNITANFDTPVLSVPAPSVLNCRDTVALLTGITSTPTVTLSWAVVTGLDTLIVGQGAEWSTTAPGTYLLLGTDAANGCRTILTQTISADTAPSLADAGPNRTIDCHGTPVELMGSAAVPGVIYLWSAAIPGIIIADPTSATQTVDAPGNYTLVVERTDNYCRDTAQVEVFGYENGPAPILSITPPTCRGDGDGRLAITAESAQGPYEFLLDGQSNGNDPLFSALEGGIYALEVIDAQGCQWNTEVMVPEPAALTVDLGADLTVQSGEIMVVEAALSVPMTALEALVWGPTEALSCTDVFCLEQEIAMTAQTEVWLTAIDTNGCSVTDRVLLSVQVDPVVYIPNVFSPDNDGQNDMFTIYTNSEVDQIVSLQVYERWGAEVFHRENFQPNDPLQGWNGRHREQPLNPDVFVYWTKIRFKDGTERIFEGDVTLVR